MKTLNLKIPDNINLKEQDVYLMMAVHLYNSGKLTLEDIKHLFGISEKELEAEIKHLQQPSDKGFQQKVVKEPDQHSKMKPGLAKGLVEMKPDFDEPLDDFKDYM